jgi:hypothetical protein
VSVSLAWLMIFELIDPTWIKASRTPAQNAR